MDGSLFRRLAYLLPFFRRYRLKLAAGMLSILTAAVFGLVTPLLVGRAIDTLRLDFSRRAVLGYAGLLLLVSLCQGIFSFAQRMLLVTTSRDIEFDLRNLYFASLERQAPAFFQEHPTGDLMARATNDLQAVRMLCGPAIMYGTNTLATGVGALSLMARIHWPLTVVALIAMPLLPLVTKVFGQRIHTLFEDVQGRFSDLSTRVQENLAGVRVVRAYAREAGEAARFEAANREYVARNRSLIGWSAAFHPAIQAIVGLGFVAVLWYGGLLVTREVLTVGEYVTFNFFLGKLVWPMIAIGWVANLAQRGSASLGRIRAVLEAPPAIADEEPKADVQSAVDQIPEPEAIAGAVRFLDLTFSYREDLPPALAGIELRVAPGETVALVGRTGAGKTTLLSLVPRLLDPPPGSLFVDGYDVRRLPLARLRGSIGMVPQETFLFSASVRDNVALGRPEASEAEVLEAAELAGLGPDLEAFPAGLATLVGERGLTLSGGQKQRVALARALLMKPRLLLLDDCLSAVDTQTEERILQSLRRVFEGRTVFLVSHRISTVKDADQILVLDRGEIVERGTHAQLLAAGGLYADLHQRQMLEEELAAV